MMVTMGKHRLIYIVDRDKSSRKGLTRLLEAAEHNVASFTSLDELQRNNDISKDAILLLDADQTALAMKNLHNYFLQKEVSLPLIILTARDDKQSHNMALAARAVGYFRKPVDGPALLDAIAWVFDTHKQFSA
jgi:FixJ family two-component response regulator